MTDFREIYFILKCCLSFCWWSWIASKYSGGGPKHPSYTHAKFVAYVNKVTIQRWLSGAM